MKFTVSVDDIHTSSESESDTSAGDDSASDDSESVHKNITSTQEIRLLGYAPLKDGELEQLKKTKKKSIEKVTAEKQAELKQEKVGSDR